MATRSIAAIVVFLVLASELGGREQRGPSTPAERAKAVQVAHQLETEPLAKGAKEERQWMTQWLIEVPDIHVSLCTEFFPGLLDTKKNHSVELAMQGPFSMVAFEIEHPDRASDESARYLAAVEGTLTAYEAILKSEPKARWPALDELIAKRAKGELVAFVQETVPRCKSK